MGYTLDHVLLSNLISKQQHDFVSRLSTCTHAVAKKPK